MCSRSYLTGITKTAEGRGLRLSLQCLVERFPCLLRELAVEVRRENLTPIAVDCVNLTLLLFECGVAGFAIDPSEGRDVGCLFSPIMPSGLGELEIFEKEKHDLSVAGGCPNDDASWGSLTV